MSTIETLNNWDSWLDFRTKLNDNFDNLNTDKVEWPASAVDENIAVFDSTTWKLIKDWWAKVSDLWDITAWANIADNAIVRWDWWAKWVQDSNILIDDEDTIENTRGIKLDTSNVPTLTPEWTVWWNWAEYTLNIETWLWPTLQVWQETLILIYNDTGSQIDNWKILHPVWWTAAWWEFVPTVEYADASSFDKCQWTLFVATSNIGIGSLWFATIQGKVRGVDTSTLWAWAQVWLSDTNPWDFVNEHPEFPSYVISMWGTLNADASWQIFINQTTRVEDTFTNAWDGSIRETFDFRIVSSGTVITWTLSNPHATNTVLTVVFSDWLYEFDCTAPACDITLTWWSATVPQMNYVYIDKTTKALTVSTSEFPITEHAKVAIVSLLNASSTQTDWALRNQNTNDHIKTDLNNGHILHMAERIRTLNADWDNWVAATLSWTTANVYIATTSWQVYQMHKQTFVAQDMSTWDDIHVVNDPTTPYRTTSNLNDITEYSDWSTWNNDWSNIVVWGVCNKTWEASHLMVNLPSDWYNTEANAVEDRNNFTNYTIPKEFKWVGFLIARFTIRRSGAAFTYNSWVGYLDLRWFYPNNTAWGWTGGSWVSDFTALSDTPASYIWQGWKILSVNSWETAVEFDKDAPTWDIVWTTDTQTLTNKRITERVNTITSSATPTPAWDTTDEFTVTALAVNATFAAPTWTPTEWQVLLVRIKDDWTARTLAWNAIYRASTDLPLPTTTIISKTLYLQFVYNNTDSKWDLLGLLNNF